MATVTAHIDVIAPVTPVYNAWTQFESFPEFMGAVENVTQVDDTTNHWIASIGGVEREFNTRITEQIPDQLIAWESIDGNSHTGRVTFESVEVAEPDPDAVGINPALSQPSVGGLTSGAPAAVVQPEFGSEDPSGPAPESREATRVSVEFTWDDETFLEKLGDKLGLDDHQAKKDLERFKELVESGDLSGGWRGEVHGGHTDGESGGTSGTATG